MDVTRPDTAAGKVSPEGVRKSYDAFISYAHDADEAFAPVLQHGLQHLTKPWNQRRAMEVFRDESSLAVSAGLWPSIQNALDSSRWFIHLASPEAAQSSWVAKEITHWVSRNGTDHLLIVVTSGTWAWDNDSGDLSPASSAGNPALHGVFPSEPKYLDMTWARRNASLTLRNARFRDQIATLVAAIREVPKDEIEGEDVRQQRRTRRIVQVVISALTVLVLLASALAVAAYIQRQQAVYQRDVAVSGQLISQSELLGDTNPAIARLLSIAAWRINRTSNARYAMLAAAALPGIAVLTGHAGAVNAVAFSPDGKSLASGGVDGTVRLWDVATHQQIGGPLTGHVGPVTSVAFSPDGKTLASGMSDGTVRLWDVATHQEMGSPLHASHDKILGFHNVVLSVAFSPDGKTLASDSTDGTVRLWSVATHQQIGKAMPGHVGSGSSVAFSPDGKTLASAMNDGTVRLRDVATHQQIGGPSPATPARSTRWRSAQTARPWPPAATITHSDCGMWPPTVR